MTTGLPPLHPLKERSSNPGLTIRNTNGKRNYAIRARIADLEKLLLKKQTEFSDMMPEPYPETEEEIDAVSANNPGIFDKMHKLFEEISKIERTIRNLNKLGGKRQSRKIYY